MPSFIVKTLIDVKTIHMSFIFEPNSGNCMQKKMLIVAVFPLCVCARRWVAKFFEHIFFLVRYDWAINLLESRPVVVEQVH